MAPRYHAQPPLITGAPPLPWTGLAILPPTQVPFLNTSYFSFINNSLPANIARYFFAFLLFMLQLCFEVEKQFGLYLQFKFYF